MRGKAFVCLLIGLEFSSVSQGQYYPLGDLHPRESFSHSSTNDGTICDLWKYVLSDPHFPLLSHGYNGKPRYDEAILALKIEDVESDQLLFEVSYEASRESLINPLDSNESWFFNGEFDYPHSSLNAILRRTKSSLGTPHLGRREGKYFQSYYYRNSSTEWGEDIEYHLDGHVVSRINQSYSPNPSLRTSWKCVLDYTYQNGRISEVHVKRQSSETDYQYVYDERGLLVERLEFINNSYFPSFRRQFGYDDFGNISSIRAHREGGEEVEIRINYQLDEFNRWVSASIELWQLKKVGDEYPQWLKRKSTQIRRLIRYVGDTSPLSRYAQSSGVGANGTTLTVQQKLEVHTSLERLEETMGQSLVVLVGKDGGCLAAGNELSNLALILEAVLSGSFTVVSRSGLDEILEEQRLSMSGLVDEQNEIEAGKLLGAEICLIVSAECVNNRSTLNVQALNSETSEILWNIVGIGATNTDVIGVIQNAIFQR